MPLFSVSRVLPCWCLLLSSLFAVSTAQAQVPAPDLAAKAWLLLDTNSGQVLTERDADAPVEPASLTKLMTAYLVFAALRQQTISLEQKVNVSKTARAMSGSRMFLDLRTPVAIKDLLHGMIVQSGNDATQLLAETVGGSEAAFVELMNREAQRMGLTHTRFTNPSGLPDRQHVSTARDLSVLATRLIADFPEFYSIYSEHEFEYNHIRQPNRNRLLRLDPTVDGLKTGHTDSAGFCLIASAKRGDHRLLSVVLGTNSDDARTQESLKLLNFGYQYFDAVKLYAAQQAVSTPQVWKGASNSVPLGFTHDLYVTVPHGAGARLKAQLALPQKLLAPLSKGQVVGKLILSLDDKVLQELPITALEDVAPAGIFGRAWDTIKLWVK
ncbi:MAG: D-alanyl-D-alanine carboxypeptidase [Burkholderiaceae bacterium]|nr:MAG: D-alanyl-D-alanine carboxypeptidase [Burkholderiaceae bacterium]